MRCSLWLISQATYSGLISTELMLSLIKTETKNEKAKLFPWVSISKRRTSFSLVNKRTKKALGSFMTVTPAPLQHTLQHESLATFCKLKFCLFIDQYLISCFAESEIHSTLGRRTRCVTNVLKGHFAHHSRWYITESLPKLSKGDHKFDSFYTFTFSWSGVSYFYNSSVI